MDEIGNLRRSWVSRLGDAVGARLTTSKEEIQRQLAEPPLTDGEQALIGRYRAVRPHLSLDDERLLPPLPAKETAYNRQELRTFAAAPALPAIIAKGEAAKQADDAVKAEAARIEAERQEKERQEAERRRVQEEAEALTRKLRAQEERFATIEAFYANTLNEIFFNVGGIADLLPSGVISTAGELAFEDSRSTVDKNWLGSESTNLTDLGGKALYKGLRKGFASDAVESASFQRTLVSMTPEQRAALRLADVLHALGFMSDDEVRRAKIPVVWNKGECLIVIPGGYGSDLRKRDATLSALKVLINAYFGEPAVGTETIKLALSRILKPGGAEPHVQATLERYMASGARWMVPNDVPPTSDPTSSPSALRLGRFGGSEREFVYDRRESLVTIAAPGTGKSQAHVLRNLLYLRAPAVVLDIKGEMRAGSAGWRRANVGPVHVFAPSDPTASLSYNPLDDIGTDRDFAWDEARRLADLLVVPPSTRHGADDYFESRARDMITVALLDVALNEPTAHRTMGAVLDRLYTSADEDVLAWCRHLEASGVPQLRRQASALRGMPPKQREGIFDSARRQLEIWQSPAIERLSGSTTFQADSLRQESATLYICVALEDVKKYASVIRVLIGQTVHKLCRGAPEAGSAPVTFFLDELPRLGRMDVIEEALDVGRGYGVRLWMFCQNVGQMETAYPNAEGMLKNCAIRAYMNPDEDTAHTLSRNIGEREGLLDGQRRRLVEASQLAGPDFGEKVIVFGRSSHVANLEKCPAYADPVCVERMQSG